MVFYKNVSFLIVYFPKVAIVDKSNFYTKFFLWHYFLSCHGPPGTHGPAGKIGI